MVNPEQFKKDIEQMLSQEYKVEFLGTNFDHIVNLLTDIKVQKIYNWLNEVIQHKFQPIVISSPKPYKEWTVNELLTFRYPFSIGTTEYRILFVKIKNSVYIEFHLGDHKYYDKVRKDLNLK
ncbi:MAG: hypothetical protein A3D39_00620 [Candidatus Buchananbacteria bacterium RIFCSPHIGHO2_02_FULL_39_17]|uniref:Uncharacterized protein n=1 Tax=Candidatus Buchananbacteria bacterium RIFCSPLOWO2_01_FULL_40_23b TaxID=1797544 RepID=A0A1G1YLD1_9BACT|nr:MAG: hypothetical protein A3D39_00620 [Candidatus Buchananbacteria bacterium RIFCSPHIGHO2_02_FULL_39_17]OGY53168.1 MAG: hypothetical protein A2912_04300 [Candidatus Buchananbacteria bacterium RIFCSPLOWO2_01_FULL_40_23b]